jgi:hypothetical protein
MTGKWFHPVAIDPTATLAAKFAVMHTAIGWGRSTRSASIHRLSAGSASLGKVAGEAAGKRQERKFCPTPMSNRRAATLLYRRLSRQRSDNCPTADGLQEDPGQLSRISALATPRTGAGQLSGWFSSLSTTHVCETAVRTPLGLVDPAKQECYEALAAAELGAQGSPLVLSKLNEQHPAGNPYPDIVPLRRRSGFGSVEQFQASPCPSRDYLEASHSHERHTVHGLHEHKSHEQDVPCGDGNKGCRLCSCGQSFQPIDKPARYRQNL